MNGATISADIISFTSLSENDKRNIEHEINILLVELTEKYKEDGLFVFLQQ
jgi:hypothetical protein